MMKLIDDLIADGHANAAPVREVRVGISWTGRRGIVWVIPIIVIFGNRNVLECAHSIVSKVTTN